MTDYSDMEQEIMDTPDAEVLPRGSEEKLRIINHTEGEGEYGTWHLLTFDIPAKPLVKEIRRFISDPKDAANADEGIKQKVFRGFKYFTTCFGIDLSKPLDWDTDLISLEGWCILGHKVDDEYGPQNTISKFVVKK